MRGRKFYFGLFLTVLCLSFLVSSAQAIEFSGDILGVFQAPVGPSTMVTTGEGTTHFIWGTAQTATSSLQFASDRFSGNFEAEFLLGALSYRNGTIIAGTQADSVNLEITLGFDPLGSATLINTFTYVLIDTPDTASDPWGNADIVSLANLFDQNAAFSTGGKNYYLQILRYEVLEDYEEYGRSDGSQFYVLEDATASAYVYAKLTENPPNNPVPEPATMLLLASGLVGLAGLRKKFKR